MALSKMKLLHTSHTSHTLGRRSASCPTSGLASWARWSRRLCGSSRRRGASLCFYCWHKRQQKEMEEEVEEA